MSVVEHGFQLSPGESPQTVCVVGLGYIGLPTAAILANRGYQVTGVDVYESIVDTINRGEVHLHEPHLDQLVRKVVDEGRLRASLSPCEADVYFICVPTPFQSDRSPDLAYVEAAAKSIQPLVRPGNIVILESTSPPNTTQGTVLPLAIPEELQVGKDVFVAYCPERVLPGRILIEAIENDRIVGGITEACTAKVKAFYETFVTGQVLPTDALSAELAKLVENSYRDVNIAFANELSRLTDEVGADAFEVIRLANHHPRVNILTPGPGVGGHCISVDPWFLVHAAPAATPLIRTARTVNDAKPHYVVEQVLELAAEHDDPTIGCLGLTYKADVDDMRESPSLEITLELVRRYRGEVLACDPFVDPGAAPDLTMAELRDVVARSKVLVLLTDHQVFRELPNNLLHDKVLVDPRGVWRNVAREQSSAPLRRAA